MVWNPSPHNIIALHRVRGCSQCRKVIHYETSKNFETIPTKNLYPVAHNLVAQDIMPFRWVVTPSLDIRSLATKNMSCMVKIFSWNCLKILGTFIHVPLMIPSLLNYSLFKATRGLRGAPCSGKPITNIQGHSLAYF